MTTPTTAPAAPMEAWDAIAAQFDEHVTPGNFALATAALRLAGLQSGHRFLDVAAGTGSLGLPAARLGAEVLGTDWSPAMVERFTARAVAEGLPAVARVMDCHDLDLADDSYDITGSQFGVMLVPDEAVALREMVRVTRPGGRVLLVAFGNPAYFEALQFLLAALRAVVPGFTGPGPGAPLLEFQVSDPEVLRTRLVEAGLTEVTVETGRQERVEVRSGADLWTWCLSSNPIPGRLVADLGTGQRAEVIAVLDGMVRERAGGAGTAVLTAPVNIGVGRKAGVSR